MPSFIDFVDFLPKPKNKEDTPLINAMLERRIDIKEVYDFVIKHGQFLIMATAFEAFEFQRSAVFSELSYETSPFMAGQRCFATFLARFCKEYEIHVSKRNKKEVDRSVFNELDNTTEAL